MKPLGSFWIQHSYRKSEVHGTVFEDGCLKVVRDLGEALDHAEQVLCESVLAQLGLAQHVVQDDTETTAKDQEIAEFAA